MLVTRLAAVKRGKVPWRRWSARWRLNPGGQPDWVPLWVLSDTASRYAERPFLATISSTHYRPSLPAIPPIADSAEASVRFLGFRRLDPQVRAAQAEVPFARR